MENHYQLADEEFEASFADGSLDPQVFNHEAHLRIAWIHITKYGTEKAIENIVDQLKAYTKQIGASDKIQYDGDCRRSQSC